MHKAMTALAAAALAFATASGASAQSGTDFGAYGGIITTPLGALPQSVSWLTPTKAGMRFTTSYGYLGLDGNNSWNNVGLGVDMSWRGARVGLTGGYAAPSCETGAQCDGYMMIGGNWTRHVTSTTVGNGADASRINVGLDVTAGYGKPQDAGTWSTSLGVPIALETMGGGRRIAPYVAPRFAVGRYHDATGNNDSGTALMLGGGVAVPNFTQSVGLNVGFQKVFVQGAPTQFGVGLTWSGR
jgi:hypothetical protein